MSKTETAPEGKLSREMKSVFDQLYDGHKAAVFRYLCYLTRDRSVSEDLFQETWLRVVRHLDRLEGIREVKSWLYSIATNLYRDHLRRQKVRSVFMSRVKADPAGTRFLGGEEVRDPEAETEKQEMAAAVMGVLEHLPLKMRQVFVLREIEGFGYDEIARMLNLPRGTAKSRMHRAVRLIRRELGDNRDFSGIQLGDFA
jgi:RNA polymerase sigma-70 factor (ECF subfamily)